MTVDICDRASIFSTSLHSRHDDWVPHQQSFRTTPDTSCTGSGLSCRTGAGKERHLLVGAMPPPKKKQEAMRNKDSRVVDTRMACWSSASSDMQRWLVGCVKWDTRSLLCSALRALPYQHRRNWRSARAGPGSRVMMTHGIYPEQVTGDLPTRSLCPERRPADDQPHGPKLLSGRTNSHVYPADSTTPKGKPG